MGTGPNDTPHLFGAPNQPAVLSGSVLFENNYEAKGNDISIKYAAVASVYWNTESSSSTTNSDGTTSSSPTSSSPTSHSHRDQKVYDERAFMMTIAHTKPGKISPGKYCTAINFTIDPSWPSSSIGVRRDCWMTYKVVATLHRKCPSRNVVRESTIWVFNTCLNRPGPNLPISLNRFNGTFDKVVPYICAIPSEALHFAQKVPVTFKAFPTLVYGEPMTVLSATVKLKQYTYLKAGIETRRDSRDVMNIAMNDGWPVPIPEQPWQRTMVVTLPTAPILTPTTHAECYIVTHKLKLIMQVMVGRGSKQELRIEMPVKITPPRPPGDLIPSFDLSRYLSCVNSL
ncbi:hypothetical protein BGZ52_005944 [Haplosporangium bisporale]|nr:hypothetical protein BGZ52_005944 [Haplosporangium bisporale]KAF9211088.1 hypothetical protein BGZ59_008543 [Podila verticillata]